MREQTDQVSHSSFENRMHGCRIVDPVQAAIIHDPEKR
jgi:hypothetical protein